MGKTDYFKYVREVLGASQILQPRDLERPETEVGEKAWTRTGHWPPPGEFDILVLHRGPLSLFEGETSELWEKMKSAMKLESLRWLEVETQQKDLEGTLLELLASYPAKVSLLLQEAPKRTPDLRVLGSSKVLESFAPTMLLEVSDLKKQAWADLQVVMRSFGQN